MVCYEEYDREHFMLFRCLHLVCKDCCDTLREHRAVNCPMCREVFAGGVQNGSFTPLKPEELVPPEDKKVVIAPLYVPEKFETYRRRLLAERKREEAKSASTTRQNG